MRLQRVRMSDVADRAGVSRTTASFVLNGRDVAIPAETRQRVLQAARQLGYRPHSAARALATGRTQRIGIVLNDPEGFGAQDTYFTNVLAGVTAGALRHNYNLLLYSAHYPDWRALHGDILAGAADGTLLIGRRAGDDLAPALLDTDVPTVCISFRIDHPRCHYADCDNEAGARMAIQHLLRLGHRQIAFLYPGEAISWGRERRQGALRAMEEAGLSAENLLLFEWRSGDSPSQEWTAAAVELLQTARPRPTALFCCDEEHVCCLLEPLSKQGTRIPEDLAVVSFNSTDLSRRSHPALTSVWQPLKEIGAAGVDLLVGLITGCPESEPGRRFPVRLDVRESCGARARGLPS